MELEKCGNCQSFLSTLIILLLLSYKTAMGRTKGSANKRNQNPEKHFDGLPAIKKLIAYNYWTFLDSQGKEGWDIKKSGSTKHYNQSAFIQDNVEKKSFYHLGKVSFILPANCMLLLELHVATRITRFSEG